LAAVHNEGKAGSVEIFDLARWCDESNLLASHPRFQVRDFSPPVLGKDCRHVGAISEEKRKHRHQQ
jgi:hypothetical protein